MQQQQSPRGASNEAARARVHSAQCERARARASAAPLRRSARFSAASALSTSSFASSSTVSSPTDDSAFPPGRTGVPGSDMATRGGREQARAVCAASARAFR